MTEHFDSDAQEYLLNQMDAARRAAFEQELQRSPEAQVALKACADAMAGFATEIAPPEPLSADDQRQVLGAILTAIQTPHSAHPARREGRGVGLRWLWPVAAAILLGLNLVEFDRPFAPPGHRPAIAITEKSMSPTDPTSRDPANKMADGKGMPSEKGLAPADPARSVGPASDEPARELERLRANVVELERARQRLRAEYDALVDRVTNVGVVNRDLNRLTTMELVDAGSFARGERRGLVSVGRGILTEPGVVIPVDPPPSPATGTAIPQPRLPYAWSVFDEKEQKGYLNLYNLPTPSSEQSLQAWVRSADSRDFQRVGEVPPQYYGSNGSLQYVLPNPTSTPAEILITVEPRGAPPAGPTGPPVLRGP